MPSLAGAGSLSPTPTAAPTGRWTSCARGSGCGGSLGLHCYDVLAGPSRMRALFDAEPGTYVLTDYLVRSFQRTVVAGLGLDAHPELWPDYFRHYRRVVWLAQDRSAPMQAQAEQVAARFGLPLTVIETGTSRWRPNSPGSSVTRPARARRRRPGRHPFRTRFRRAHRRGDGSL